MSATVNINGKIYQGSNISISGNTIKIDGVVRRDDVQGVVEVRVMEGVIVNLQTDASVTCENVAGDIQAGGSVSCGNVNGDVQAGGSVSCGKVQGDIMAGGSVMKG